MFRKKLRIPLDAGDCVIFDSRLPHASSANQVTQDKIPKEHQKITLYWDVAGNEENAEVFIENAMFRALKFTGIGELFFCNYLRYHYPLSFNTSYINLVNKSNSIIVKSLEKDRADFFQSIYKKSPTQKYFKD